MVFKENLSWTPIASFSWIKIKLSQNLENTGLIKGTPRAHTLYISPPVANYMQDIRCQKYRRVLKVSSLFGSYKVDSGVNNYGSFCITKHSFKRGLFFRRTLPNRKS